MSATARLEAIREFLRTLDGVKKPKIRDTTKVERFVTQKGVPIVLEPRGKRHNNIWVRADTVDARLLSGIESNSYANASEGDSKPNHHLFADPLLKSVDLIRFEATSLDDVRRIVDAICLARVTS